MENYLKNCITFYAHPKKFSNPSNQALLKLRILKIIRPLLLLLLSILVLLEPGLQLSFDSAYNPCLSRMLMIYSR